MRLMPAAALAACLLAGCLLAGFWARAQAPGLGAGAELVDPDHFRVCADPNNLPYSNEKGEGFENKIAEMFGHALNKPVTYTYYPQVIGFVRNTLNAFRCDVVMGTGVGDVLVQTTNPYYHTVYVLFFKPGSGLDGVTSLEDPRLKGKRIGVIARTPPATILAAEGLLDNVHSYPLTVDTRVDAPSKSMMDDLKAGVIDAGLLWGPMAGWQAKNAGIAITLVPLLHEKGAPMDFRIAMGVRHSDQTFKRELNRLIAEHQDDINKLLIAYGVPLLDEQGNLMETTVAPTPAPVKATEQ